MKRLKDILSCMCAVLLLGSCRTFAVNDSKGAEMSESKQPRLELPAIRKDEVVVTYRGYTDIAYKDSIPTISDPDKIAYSVSYDEIHKIPRWVAYDLTKEETYGYAKRNGKIFREDPSLPVAQPEDYDYRGSGWTRGHLAPAADFKWSDQALSDSFYFTNCCPQTAFFNGTSWERLERRVRQWAREKSVIYVVTGPIIGEGKNGVIGENRVCVPDAFFKAVLAVCGTTFQAVGFIMENNSQVQPYASCIVSVDEIEDITGLDLFCELNDSVEKIVESRCDKEFWGL